MSLFSSLQRPLAVHGHGFWQPFVLVFLFSISVFRSSLPIRDADLYYLLYIVLMLVLFLDISVFVICVA